MPTKIQDILDMLRKDGWEQEATRGSHRQFRHPEKPGRVTVAGKSQAMIWRRVPSTASSSRPD